MLSKLGKAMGGAFEFPGLETQETVEEEGEEYEEATLHSAASAGATPQETGAAAGQQLPSVRARTHEPAAQAFCLLLF